MSVQSEITRLANAKTALATAIEGKGVTVPEGTKLDGMAALVEAIEAGGGSIYTGSFSFESDETWPSLPIENTGGKYPEWVAVWNENTASAQYKLKIGIYHNKSYAASGTNYIIQDARIVYQTTYRLADDYSCSTNSSTIMGLHAGIGKVICYAGDVYHFVAFGEMPS